MSPARSLPALPACPARGVDEHGAGAPHNPTGEPKAKKEKKEKKEKKAKKGKADGKPGEEKAKRPPSAYNIYMKLELPKSKASNPELAHSEHFKAVAAKWGLLSKDEQQAFKGLSC